MAACSEGDLAIGGIGVHYYRMGTPGKPPGVFLHGFSDAGLGWLRLAADLGPGYDLVMFDAAGHGRSGGVEHGFGERAAGDVLAAIERLGLDRPVLVGHSMGAGTAAAVAVEASERLRGVVLEDPGWWDGEEAPTLGAREVARITCPVLLVTADPARGGIVTPAVAEEARRLGRSVRVVQVPDAGHNVRRDNYAPYRAAVAAFLGEVLADR